MIVLSNEATVLYNAQNQKKFIFKARLNIS